MATLEVVSAGVFATLQDLGRFGYSDMGLGRSGAADRGAAALANRMVGNLPDAALIEVALGGLALRADGNVLVAITGASCAVTVSGPCAGQRRGAAVLELIALSDGQVLRLETPTIGLRNYLAVRGGFSVPPILGSRSYDTLAQIGPPPLSNTTRLPVGSAAGDWPIVGAVAPPLTDDGPTLLEVTVGPRADWFTSDALIQLVNQVYQVNPRSDRIGMRLDAGNPLERVDTRELPSEGVEEGSLQVAPDGFPVLFLADHPVTGGYPVIAVVRAADVDRAAQARPGDFVCFRIRTR